VYRKESAALGVGVADVLTRSEITGPNLRRALRHAIARSVRASLPDAAFSEAVSSGGDVSRLRDALAKARGDFAVMSIHFDELAPGAPPLPIPSEALGLARAWSKTVSGRARCTISARALRTGGTEQDQRSARTGDAILERLEARDGRGPFIDGRGD
jgi:hypothetical protein